MSTSQLIAVLQRATDDLTYRELLFTNPNEALKGYTLTTNEHQQLSNLNAENFETFKGQWIPGG
jgi:hypothetical protein